MSVLRKFNVVCIVWVLAVLFLTGSVKAVRPETESAAVRTASALKGDLPASRLAAWEKCAEKNPVLLFRYSVTVR